MNARRNFALLLALAIPLACSKKSYRESSSKQTRDNRTVYAPPYLTKGKDAKRLYSRGGKKQRPDRQPSGPRKPAELKNDAEAKARVRHNTESYDRIYENPFLAVKTNPLSTFSLDVDTASYSNTRRFLNQGRLPPKGAVRIEELVNYFNYDYQGPRDEKPFGVETEVSRAPWNKKNLLLKIGIAGRNIAAENMPARNLTFLLDVSGSMFSRNKLPLLKRSLKLLASQLNEKDRVAIVVYAGASGLILPPVSGDRKSEILNALDRLRAGGSTNGGAGIRLAYKIARKIYRKGAVNRVILATDGDFNVGTTNRSELIRLIEKERESGVFLTVLGFGMGNYKDGTMEQLANKGNGNYAYIDNYAEARKALATQAGGTLVTIAKDVKLQLEFNPKYVKAYRLIGYENRLLRAEDFNNDKKDAGEIGAGHTVTALYEIVPRGGKIQLPGVDPLRYSKEPALSKNAHASELLTVKIRYKQPEGSKSSLLTYRVSNAAKTLKETSRDFRFAAGVAAFGMLLRDSKHKGQANFAMVRSLAEEGRGKDKHGYRAEFIRLVQVARSLK